MLLTVGIQHAYYIILFVGNIIIILVLGMHFCQAVAIIQSQVGIIKGVQVLYSDKVYL